MDSDIPKETQKPFTKDSLAELLRQTKKAHTEYEKALGRKDEKWPEWYAAYIIDHSSGNK